MTNIQFKFGFVPGIVTLNTWLIGPDGRHYLAFWAPGWDRGPGNPETVMGLVDLGEGERQIVIEVPVDKVKGWVACKEPPNGSEELFVFDERTSKRWGLSETEVQAYTGRRF